MTYSAHFKKTVNAVSASEVPLMCLEINHEGLLTPIRIVNDNADLTSNGNTYQAMAFRVDLPNDPETGIPQAKLSVDNIGKDLMQWIDGSGGAVGATVNIQQILRSDPDTVEYEIELALVNIHADAMEVSGDLSFDDIFGKPCLPILQRPDVAPDIF